MNANQISKAYPTKELLQVNMKKCCLELRLSPVSNPPQSRRRNSLANPSPSVINSKDIIVIYNGRLCICDVTELQVRARLEMERVGRELTAVEVPLVGIGSPLGFSVKRSLQRFLQQRKKRRQGVAPYSLPPSSSISFP